MQSPTTLTVGELRARLIHKAGEEPAFRARLLADPIGAVQDEIGLQPPPGFRLEVHEESPTTGHIVLPPPARLDEEALSHAAGGVDWSYAKQGWG